MVFLIFVFVAREAMPVIFGQSSSAVGGKLIAAEDIGKLSQEQLRAYLQLTPEEFKEKSPDTLKLLVELKEETAKEASSDKDASLNTASWRYMLKPYQWSDYDKPEYIWQPVSQVKKFNIIPLIVGSLKVTLVALLFAVPIALAAAIYVSQLAGPRVREVVKPCIELLSGIPSVVLGFFALIVMASFFQGIFHYSSRLNSFVAGVALWRWDRPSGRRRGRWCFRRPCPACSRRWFLALAARWVRQWWF
jgi:ABC-type dipeptide/oligopeptide/nickel transport system permease component